MDITVRACLYVDTALPGVLKGKHFLVHPILVYINRILPLKLMIREHIV